MDMGCLALQTEGWRFVSAQGAERTPPSRGAGLCLDFPKGKTNTRDPIGERGGWNLYTFVTNNPMYWVDFLGLDRLSIVVINEGDDLVTDIAGTFSVGEIYVKDFEDAVAKIKKKVGDFDKCGKDGNCIANLMFIGHNAGAGNVLIGEDAISVGLINSKFSRAKSFLNEIKALLCCKGAHVEFRQCHSGDGKAGDEFGNLLAKLLGARVSLHVGEVNAVTGPPTFGLSEDWKEIPGTKRFPRENSLKPIDIIHML